MSEISVFDDLKKLANLGYQIRLLKMALEDRVPLWLIDAIIEATTGYVRSEEP